MDVKTFDEASALTISKTIPEIYNRFQESAANAGMKIEVEDDQAFMTSVSLDVLTTIGNLRKELFPDAEKSELKLDVELQELQSLPVRPNLPITKADVDKMREYLSVRTQHHVIQFLVMHKPEFVTEQEKLLLFATIAGYMQSAFITTLKEFCKDSEHLNSVGLRP